MAIYDKFRRQTHRLVGYHYSQTGLYFITICTKNMEHFFGEVQHGEMLLSDVGKIVYDNWLLISQLYPHIYLHEFVVMPNHIHGILEIKDRFTNTGSQLKEVSIDTKSMSTISPKSGSVPRIINSYKAACTSKIRSSGIVEFAWQARFHDHIIRNQNSYHRISEYILQNPQKWTEDRYCLPQNHCTDVTP